MSEAELHILAGRLQDSRLAAAKRGDLRTPLPVGYVYDEDRRPILDPSEEIQEAVAGVFAAFEVTGSANAAACKLAGRPFPRRAYGGTWAGEIRWGRLTRARVSQILSNPAYAGAYVYGRHQSKREVTPDGSIRAKESRVSRQEWPVLILNHHAAYLSWDAFLANEKRLAANNTRSGAQPPREGPALLQGIVICGSCGLRMSTRYPCGKPKYYCNHAWSDHVQTPSCRMVYASDVDAAVAERLLAVISTEEIKLALAAAKEVQAREASRSRSFELQVERAKYEAGRAERAFHCCDPENRLVARTLEHRWEEKLQLLVDAEVAYAEDQAAKVPLPSMKDLESLAEDFSRLWMAPSTSIKDRKRILRILVADVTVMSQPAPGMEIRVGIHWQSGATEEVIVNRPWLPRRRTPEDVVEIVRRLSNCTDEEIAKELRGAGLRTGGHRIFTGKSVRRIRIKYRLPLPSFPDDNRELTVMDFAWQFQVDKNTVYYWIHRGYIQGRQCADGRIRIPFTPEIKQACQDRVAGSQSRKSKIQNGTAREAV